MNWNSFLLDVNAIVCFTIALRLMLFRRHKFSIPYHLGYSVFAYIMILINGTIVIRIMTGEYSHTDWSTVLNNIFICALLLRSGGCITNIFRYEKPTP